MALENNSLADLIMGRSLPIDGYQNDEVMTTIQQQEKIPIGAVVDAQRNKSIRAFAKNI